MSTSDQLFKPLKLELNFYDVLLEISKTRQIFLSVPETFLWNPDENSIKLICTNYETGELVVKENISKETLIDSVKFFEDLVKMRSKYPIAVIKTAGASGKDNCKVLFKEKESIETWNRLKTIGKIQILQRFIPSSWNVSLFRCSLDTSTNTCKKMLLKKTNKNIYELPGMKKNIFSNQALCKIDSEINKSYYLIKRLDQVSCNTIPEQPFLDSKMKYLVNVLEKYYFTEKPVKIISLQADWIQDTKGNLFLINVKNYQTRSGHASLLIDRPLFQPEKHKQEFSYNQLLIRRSLSPPYCFSNKTISTIRVINNLNKSCAQLPSVSSKKQILLVN